MAESSSPKAAGQAELVLAPDDPVVRATQCHGEHEVSVAPGDDDPVFSFGIATTDKAGRDVFAERQRQGVGVRDLAASCVLCTEFVPMRAIPLLLAFVVRARRRTCVLLP
jgi:hypothetical protein